MAYLLYLGTFVVGTTLWYKYNDRKVSSLDKHYLPFIDRDDDASCLVPKDNLGRYHIDHLSGNRTPSTANGAEIHVERSIHRVKNGA